MNEAAKRFGLAILVVVLALGAGVATGARFVWKYYVAPERAKSTALDTELRTSERTINGIVDSNRQLARGLVESQRLAGEISTNVASAIGAATRITDNSRKAKYIVEQLRVIFSQLYKLIGQGTGGS